MTTRCRIVLKKSSNTLSTLAGTYRVRQTYKSSPSSGKILAEIIIYLFSANLTRFISFDKSSSYRMLMIRGIISFSVSTVAYREFVVGTYDGMLTFTQVFCLSSSIQVCKEGSTNRYRSLAP